MLTNASHIWLEEPLHHQDHITFSASIETRHEERRTLWFKIPSQHADLATFSSDAFAIANIFLMMKQRVPCHFHGNISHSLLRNLTEFQSAWAVWRPERYSQVEIIPDSTTEEAVSNPRSQAIAAFSGGVDSTFTLYRHTIGACPKEWKRDVRNCLFVHGFDIPLDAEDAFDRAIKPIEKTLKNAGVRLLTMSTNLQALNIEWDDTHIAGLASTLMLFKENFSEGLIASGCAYGGLVTPWGSNPITDHLLSSSSFGIVHDGASVKRLEKIRQLSDWSDGYNNLRICFSAPKRDENCGVCAKCVMDILLTRMYGIRQSKAIPDLSDEKLASLNIPTAHQVIGFGKVVKEAKSLGVKDQWVRVLEKRIEELKRAQFKKEKAADRLSSLLKRVISTSTGK